MYSVWDYRGYGRVWFAAYRRQVKPVVGGRVPPLPCSTVRRFQRPRPGAWRRDAQARRYEVRHHGGLDDDGVHIWNPAAVEPSRSDDRVDWRWWDKPWGIWPGRICA